MFHISLYSNLISETASFFFKVVVNPPFFPKCYYKTDLWVDSLHWKPSLLQFSSIMCRIVFSRNSSLVSKTCILLLRSRCQPAKFQSQEIVRKTIYQLVPFNPCNRKPHRQSCQNQIIALLLFSRIKIWLVLFILVFLQIHLFNSFFELYAVGFSSYVLQMNVFAFQFHFQHNVASSLDNLSN